MSDLHCPATVLLVGPDPDALEVSRLRTRRVAAVYADSAPASVSTARRVADVLGVGTPALPAATLTAEALRALADQHRGETVLVVSADPDACGYRLPVELEVDELGLRVVSTQGLRPRWGICTHLLLCSSSRAASLGVCQRPARARP